MAGRRFFLSLGMLTVAVLVGVLADREVALDLPETSPPLPAELEDYLARAESQYDVLTPEPQRTFPWS